MHLRMLIFCACVGWSRVQRPIAGVQKESGEVPAVRMRRKTKRAVQKSPTQKIIKRSFSRAVSSVSFRCTKYNRLGNFHTCCFTCVMVYNLVLFCFWVISVFLFHAARTPPKTTEPFPAPLEHSFSESVLEKPGPAVKIVTPVIDRVGFPFLKLLLINS